MKVRILKAHDYVLLGSGIKQGGVYEARNLKTDYGFAYGVEVVCPETADLVFFNYDSVRFICPGVAVKKELVVDWTRTLTSDSPVFRWNEKRDLVGHPGQSFVPVSGGGGGSNTLTIPGFRIDRVYDPDAMRHLIDKNTR